MFENCPPILGCGGMLKKMSCYYYHYYQKEIVARIRPSPFLWKKGKESTRLGKEKQGFHSSVPVVLEGRQLLSL